MSNVVQLVINEEPKEVQIRECHGQRVVTFKDIDDLHQRPAGTARRNFSENKGRFIEGTDFFRVTRTDSDCTKIVQMVPPKV